MWFIWKGTHLKPGAVVACTSYRCILSSSLYNKITNASQCCHFVCLFLLLKVKTNPLYCCTWPNSIKLKMMITLLSAFYSLNVAHCNISFIFQRLGFFMTVVFLFFLTKSTSTGLDASENRKGKVKALKSDIVWFSGELWVFKGNRLLIADLQASN